MSNQDIEHLRFPVGRYNPGDDISIEDIQQWVQDIKELPQLLSDIALDVAESDLAQTYRPGSWTARQVIHHLADSHGNAYVRMKRTLTEDVPTILPYDEKLWADLPDVSIVPISTSISWLTAVHERLYYSIADLSIQQLSRQFQHADYDKPQSMAYLIGMYAWHGRHHLGHLRLALGKK